eukprot:2022007-Pleurochrysis_carterae.AAC.1
MHASDNAASSAFHATVSALPRGPTPDPVSRVALRLMLIMARCWHWRTSIPSFPDRTECLLCRLHLQRQSRARPSHSPHNCEWALRESHALRLGRVKKLDFHRCWSDHLLRLQYSTYPMS